MVTDFLPRPTTGHHSDLPSAFSWPQARIGSPLPGGSTLITSAPWSASSWPQNGPASSVPTSITRMSVRAPGMIPLPVILGPIMTGPNQQAERVQIVDVAPRDGLQADPADLNTARSAGIRTSVTVSAVCGCPYEGRVDASRVLRIVAELAETQPDEIALADTIGVGVPTQVSALFEGAAEQAAGIALRGHFHNTRNTALANIAAAIDTGVRVFDSSLGGVGGCPFAPKATGNVATEEVVYMVHEMGFDTGIDLDALIEASAWLEDQLGHGVPSLVAKAGGFPQPR